jgi:hypothetical protein
VLSNALLDAVFSEITNCHSIKIVTSDWISLHFFLRKIIKLSTNSSQMDRLCTTCWIIKGLRTKHCRESDICVPEFDHFCGWLGLPIGRDNHRFFIFLCYYEFFAQLSHFVLMWMVIQQTSSLTSGATKQGVSMLASAQNIGDYWWYGPEYYNGSIIPGDQGPGAAAAQAAGTNLLYEPSGFFATVFFIMLNSPLFFMLCFLHTITLPWIVMLIGSHTRLVLKNLTTNEVMNIGRYQHFWRTTTYDTNNNVVEDADGNKKGHSDQAVARVVKDFINPFDKGTGTANCMDLWWYRQRGMEAGALGLGNAKKTEYELVRTQDMA